MSGDCTRYAVWLASWRPQFRRKAKLERLHIKIDILRLFVALKGQDHIYARTSVRRQIFFMKNSSSVLSAN